MAQTVPRPRIRDRVRAGLDWPTFTSTFFTQQPLKIKLTTFGETVIRFKSVNDSGRDGRWQFSGHLLTKDGSIHVTGEISSRDDTAWLAYEEPA